MMDLVGQQLGNYHLLRLLGRGGFADVYLGEHVHLKTLAAIKVLQTRLGIDDGTEFLAEARTIAHLEHAHIVRVLDFGIAQGTPFLVMNYAPNGTLRQRHPKGTLVSLEDVVSYVEQIADALSYAHGQNLIHRDVKPENMLLDRQRKLLLSDFGIALLNQSSRYRSTQEVIGTVAYMAPEQLQGKPVFASDQYALGIVVYEWLCGTRPFEGTFLELLSQHMVVPPTPLSQKLPSISPDVDEVILRSLAKDPRARFSSIAAFADALRQTAAPTLRRPGPASSSRDREQLSGTLPASSASSTVGNTQSSAQPTQRQTTGSPPASPVSKGTTGPIPTLPASGQTAGTFPTQPATGQAAPSVPATPLSGSPSSIQPSSGVLPHISTPRHVSGHMRRRSIWVALVSLLIIVSCIIVYIANNTSSQQSPRNTQARTTSAPFTGTTTHEITPTPSPTATPTPTPTPLPSPGQVLYQADWSKDMAGWTGSPTWKWIEGGMLGSAGVDGSIASPPYRPVQPDYAVEARIQVLDGGTFGVAARGHDNNQAYVCNIQVGTAGSGQEVVYNININDSNYQTPAQQINLSTPRLYRIEVKANSIQCFIDGQLVDQKLDNTYLDAGMVGVYQYHAQIDVSSFKVIAL